MGYLEDLERIALTALFNPAFLALLVILFVVGRIFGKLTKKIRLWKILVLGYFALFIYAPVRDSGPILGGIFILGMLSNHVGTFFSALSWAGSLGDVLFAFRYRSAFEDIRRREQELESRERKLREAERRQAYQQQESGHRARAGWRQDAKEFRKKPGHNSTGGQSGFKPGSNDQKQRAKTRHAQPAQNDVRAHHLQVLGLKAGKDYNPDEIKRAYRRKVMKVHPDAGGSQVEFIAVQNAYEWLRKT